MISEASCLTNLIDEKILPVTFENIYFYLTEGGADNVQ